MKGIVYLMIGSTVIDRRRYYTKGERKTIITRWKNRLNEVEKYTITIVPDEQLESKTVQEVKKFGCIYCYNRAFGDSSNVRIRGVGLLES